MAFPAPAKPQQAADSETEGSPNHWNKYVVACTLLASLNSVLLGYDIGIMSGAVLFIKEVFKLSSLQEEVLVGSLNLVSLVGGLISGRYSDIMGRRRAMFTAAVIFFTGALMMGLAPNYAVLMVGRVLCGIGVGFGLVVAPVYIAELSPPSIRGALVSFQEVFINFGILLGYVFNFGLSSLPNRYNWRIMLGLGAFPAVLLAIAVFIMPESPRWLVMKNRPEEAGQVLAKTSSNQVEANQRLEDIVQTVAIEQSHSWAEILHPSPPIRKMLLVALLFHFFQQASGVDALVYYSPTVFKAAGIRSQNRILGMTIAVGVTKTLFILVATWKLDKLGRRPLIITSAVGMTVALLTVATTFQFLQHLKDGESGPLAPVILSIFGICAFMAFFSVGFGPIAYVLTSEIFPLRLRAQAMSLGIGVNRFTSGTVSLTYLSLAKAITTSGAFYLYAGIAAASVIYAYFLVPEMKGKSLEDIARLFEEKPKSKDVEISTIGNEMKNNKLSEFSTV